MSEQEKEEAVGRRNQDGEREKWKRGREMKTVEKGEMESRRRKRDWARECGGRKESRNEREKTRSVRERVRERTGKMRNRGST